MEVSQNKSNDEINTDPEFSDIEVITCLETVEKILYDDLVPK